MNENDRQDEESLPAGEPEGGPLARQKAFLEERLSTLGPVEDVAASPSPVTRALADPEVEGSEQSEEDALADLTSRALPPDFRQTRLEQYRRAQVAQDPGLIGPSEGEAADGQPMPPPPVGGGSPALGVLEEPAPPPNENWVPIGPSVLRQGQAGSKPATSGRTPAIEVAPGGNTVFAGSANGGVWRSDNAGETWHSLMDAFDLNPVNLGSDSLAVGALALDPTNTNRIFVGSGEGPGGAYFGVGPIVSVDGGVSWATEPTAPGSPELAGSAFYALAVDPGNPDRVVAATYAGLYRREPVGATFHWTRYQPGRWSSVVVARSGGVTTFYATPSNGPVQSSTDGATWAAAGGGFPNADVGRVGLAVQPNNPSVVYALVSRSSNSHLHGVYRLATSDGTWRQISGSPGQLFGPGSTGQGWYDLAIAVDPNNVNRVYLGGSIVLSGGDWSGSVFRCEVTVSGPTVSMTSTFIGNSLHGDIHTIQFAPGDSNKLWVGCDGGVFYTTNPTGAGDIFTARNTGLATLTMNYLGQHPTQPAVLMCGTQDNGGVRYTGEEAWLYSSGGDGGYSVINWNDPYKILSTYVFGGISRSTNGGQRYSYSSVNVTLASGEACLFYAPIAGAPVSGTPSDAEVVAFGSIRPWISTDFGTSWASIPNGTLAGDSLNGPIKSLTFAGATKLYAGTSGAGRVYRFTKSGATWTRTDLTALGLPLSGVVTDIAIDHSDVSGNSIYITFGGSGDYRHVWRFNGTSWSQASGPAAGDVSSLLDIQANAISTDPANPAHLYVGADIGIWRSTDSGANWAPLSHGLPDASVLDLRLHTGARLLRAATHGRGVWERRIDSTSAQGIELFVRDTQLDQGRHATVNGLPDPTAPGSNVAHWRGPGIKLDTPDIDGNYQFPLGSQIDFHQFVDKITDDFQNVGTHATSTIITRVYVQVHNRGVVPADGVRVMLLVANASMGLPALPAGFESNVQSGTPITTPAWKTVGIVTLNGVRTGFPKIAAFDLPSSMLPPPANLAGNDHHCVLALVHHPDDPFTNTTTVTDHLSIGERKSAHKNLKVVQFMGTPPSPAPVILPLHLNNPYRDRRLVTDVLIGLGGYGGRVRLLVPPLESKTELVDGAKGLRRSDDFDDVKSWATRQLESIEQNQKSNTPYDKLWAGQQAEDIRLVLDKGILFEAHDRKWIRLSSIVMEPEGRASIFLVMDRPKEGAEGEAFDFSAVQIDSEDEQTLGGIDFRVELVPAAPESKYRLELWSQKWIRGWRIVRARLYQDEKELTPEEGAEVKLVVRHKDREKSVVMRYQPRWSSFVHHADWRPVPRKIRGEGLVHGVDVAEAVLEVAAPLPEPEPVGAE